MVQRVFAAILAVISISVLIPVQQSDAASAYITRAGAVALIVESSKEGQNLAEWYRDGSMPQQPSFSDTRGDQWYDPYLEAALKLGYISTEDSQTFRPGEDLSSAEARALFARAWQRNSPIFFLRGENSSTMNIEELIEAYQISIPNSANAFPRAHFYTFIQSLYGNSAAVRLPTNATSWKRTASTQVTSRTSSTNARQGPFLLKENEGEIIRHRPSRRTVAAVQPTTNRVRTEEEHDRMVQRYARAEAQPQERSVLHNIFRTNTPRIETNPVVEQESFNTPLQPHSTSFSIALPTLGIDHLPVNHPKDPFTHGGLLEILSEGVGHLFSYPGWGGTTLIYGHSSSWPWDKSLFTKIFRRINELQHGDIVEVAYQGRNHQYRVVEHRTVPAKDMSSLQDEGQGEQLILYTCWPPDSIAERYLVIAEPVETIVLN